MSSSPWTMIVIKLLIEPCMEESRARGTQGRGAEENIDVICGA